MITHGFERNVVQMSSCFMPVADNNTPRYLIVQNFRCFNMIMVRLFLVDSPAKVSESSSQLLSSLGCDHVQVTQEHCHCICTKAGKKWRKVLRHLGTEEVAIENLEENYNRVEEKCYQGLLAWSKSPLTKKATTKTLCDALRLAGCSKALETLSQEGMSSHSVFSKDMCNQKYIK